MTDTKETTIPVDWIGTEQGDRLLVAYSNEIRALYAQNGHRVTRVEITANHAIGLAIAEITYDGDAPADVATDEIDMPFGNEDDLPADDGESNEGDE